jgi:hypothetical protein
LNVSERATVLIEARNNIGLSHHPDEPAMGVDNGYVVMSVLREHRHNRYQ